MNPPGGQSGRPSGLVGRILGSLMRWLNRRENEWTVSLLDIQPADHLLEVGFGPGQAIQLASRIATHGFVAGIDHSETMVAEAGKRNANAIAAGRVELGQGDVGSLPFADDSFDKAWSIHSIYFWPKPLDGLRELRRVLKPGGLVAITVRKRSRDAYKPFTKEKLTALLGEAGFRQVRCEREPHATRPSVCVLGVK